MADWLLSAANAASSIGGTIIGNEYAIHHQEREQDFAASEAQKARNFNMEEAQKARQYNTAEREAVQQWNLEQWERENEYNSPEQQMRRAVAAGINPNVAAQAITGSSNAGQVQSSPQSAAPASGPAATNPGSIAQGIGQNIANSVNTFWQNEMLRKNVEGKGIENFWAPKLNKKELEHMNSEIRKNLADEGWTKENTEKLAAMWPTELEVLKLTFQKAGEELNLLKEQVETEKKRQDEIDANIGNIEADTDNKKEEKAGITARSVIDQCKATLAENGIFLDSSLENNLISYFEKHGNIDGIVDPLISYGRRKGWQDAGFKGVDALIETLQWVFTVAGVGPSLSQAIKGLFTKAPKSMDGKRPIIIPDVSGDWKSPSSSMSMIKDIISKNKDKLPKEAGQVLDVIEQWQHLNGGMFD